MRLQCSCGHIPASWKQYVQATFLLHDSPAWWRQLHFSRHRAEESCGRLISALLASSSALIAHNAEQRSANLDQTQDFRDG
jgi:hypothetical protein